MKPQVPFKDLRGGNRKADSEISGVGCATTGLERGGTGGSVHVTSAHEYPSIAQLLSRGSELQHFERVAADLIREAKYPYAERTREAIQIYCEPADIGPVILVTPDAVEFRLPTLAWPHPGIPSPSSRLWRRVDLDDFDSVDLASLLKSARAARRRQFNKCRYCGRKVPPEHRHSPYVCHGCAEQHLHVVH